MKTRKFYSFLFATVLLVVAGLSFTSCEKEYDVMNQETIDKEPPVKPEPDANFDLGLEDLKHDRQALCAINNGAACDTMTSFLTVFYNGDTLNLVKNPAFTAGAQTEGCASHIVLETYNLQLGNLEFDVTEPSVYNDGEYYERVQEWTGSFDVTNVEGLTIDFDLTNLDWSKFFNETEPVAQMPWTTVDDITLGGVVVDSIPDEAVDGKKNVRFLFTLNVSRSKQGASKVAIADLRSAPARVRAAKAATKSTQSSDFVEAVSLYVTIPVKAEVDPGQDEYVRHDQPVSTHRIIWETETSGRIEYKAVATEYYSLSGAREVIADESVRQFYITAEGTVSYNSTSKVISYNNFNNDVNSVDLIGEIAHSIETTYDLSLVDRQFSKMFGLYFASSKYTYRGTEYHHDAPTGSQTYGGVQQTDETSVVNGNITTTTTKYNVKNNISFGGMKTNVSEVVVVVSEDNGPVDPIIVSTEISQNKVEENDRTKVTVTATITYDNGDVVRKDTVVYRAHGASNAAPINVTKDNKSVVYVSNNVTSNTVGNRINYTNAVSVRYADGTTDMMNFASFQEVGGTIVFCGQTVNIQVATMVPSYINLPEGATTPGTNFDVTAWTVNCKSVIGSKTLNQNGKINVSVEVLRHPVLGRLLSVSKSKTICSVNADVLYVVYSLKYENGRKLEIDNVMLSDNFMKSNYDAAMWDDMNSATIAGPNGNPAPAKMDVHTSGTHNGYWSWQGKLAGANNVYGSNYMWKVGRYSNNPNYVVHNVTCTIDGDYMVVSEGGVEQKRFYRGDL